MPFASASVGTATGQLLPDNPARSVYFVANPPTSGVTIYIQEDGGAATANAASLAIVPGDSYTGRSKGQINAIAGSSVNVTVREY